MLVGADLNQFEASHSSFINSSLSYNLYSGGSGHTIGLTNNLFRSVALLFESFSPAKVLAYNNTFKDGGFAYSQGEYDWRIFENIFDRVNLSIDYSEIQRDFNAYIGMSNHLLVEVTRVTITNLNYATGPLGRFYLADASRAGLRQTEQNSRADLFPPAVP